MTSKSGSVAPVEELEPVVEERCYLLRREGPDSCCGKLNGQRDPVQTPADLSDSTSATCVEREIRKGVARPVTEKAHRIV
jgi:hypothetical protein